MTLQQTREAVAEGIGTFMLVLIGAGTVAVLPGNVIAAALAHGLILVAIIATYGHISGAHVNPAVTLGLLVGGKMELNRAAIYWVSQLIGGLLAAVVLRIVLDGIQDGVPPIKAVESLGQTAPAPGINALHIVLIEGILTFFLVSTVYQAAVYDKGGSAAPLLIGFTLAGAILFGGSLTGGSLNPARTIGPALLATETQNLVEVGNYLIGILLGGTLAGFLHSDTFAQEDDDSSSKKGRSKKR